MHRERTNLIHASDERKILSFPFPIFALHCNAPTDSHRQTSLQGQV